MLTRRDAILFGVLALVILLFIGLMLASRIVDDFSFSYGQTVTAVDATNNAVYAAVTATTIAKTLLAPR